MRFLAGLSVIFLLLYSEAKATTCTKPISCNRLTVEQPTGFGPPNVVTCFTAKRDNDGRLINEKDNYTHCLCNLRNETQKIPEYAKKLSSTSYYFEYKAGTQNTHTSSDPEFCKQNEGDYTYYQDKELGVGTESDAGECRIKLHCPRVQVNEISENKRPIVRRCLFAKQNIGSPPYPASAEQANACLCTVFGKTPEIPEYADKIDASTYIYPYKPGTDNFYTFKDKNKCPSEGSSTTPGEEIIEEGIGL